ncbi:MAG: cation-transporting P-type ATPase [Cyanobacteria bacterium RU_5_0]|nr:cation-transporting P-type ATPase [Cyanobacteria bacterium RU_5_0]
MTSHHPIWTLTTEDVYQALGTSAQGLAEDEAASRLKQYGYNELPEPARRSLLLRFIDQLTHFMALLLWVAGILAFISNTPELGWAIWAVIWINAAFSFWQEYQAEQALAALKRVLPVQVKVYRGGVLRTILARELVPGDVIQLEEGDRISADARLVASQSFYVDVSVLTGESLPVSRHPEPVTTEIVPPAEVANLIFAGSTVATGRGTAVVHATGAQTELGQVAHLTASVKREPSTLEVQIAKIVQLITVIAVGMGVTVFLLSYLLIGMDVKESFVFGIGIIVANVPEGLLPTVSLALAIAVQRMARRKALVRRLSAVETLSATTVICTDKTGTLTKNEMTVCALWIPTGRSQKPGVRSQKSEDRGDGGGEEVSSIPFSSQSKIQNLKSKIASSVIEVTGVGYMPQGEVRIPDSVEPWNVDLLLAGAALCSNAKLVHPVGSSQWQEIGDPTEAALLVVALKAGLDLETLQQRSPRLREIPFDSRRRMMTVVLNWKSSDLWTNEAPYLSFTKGAPVEVSQRCRFILQDGQPHDMTAAERDAVIATNDHLASQGYRVLGIAARKGGSELLEQDAHNLEYDLIFIGLMAMIDPPRTEVAEAIALCHQAGIAVTMVTGDYGLTAEAIAHRIGLVNHKARVVTGEQMGHLSDAQLRQILHHHQAGLIFARVAPEQKLRLVQAYKALGHVVAVTGDGVNDAPALRAANIGIAMGISGTDVAREAADIVLIDDNFATIVSAIEQGRAVYQNIRKFMTYILSSNVPEIVPFLAMVAFKIPPALTILQILVIDLGTDMVPALALGAELPETGIMQQPPRPKKKPLLDQWLLVRAYVFLGIIEAIAGMVGFFLVWWSHGYAIADIQRVTPAILAHTADPTVTAIYRQATTMTLAAIVACQVGNIFACRSDRASIFRIGWFSNRLVWVGIAVELVLLLAIVNIVPLSQIFATNSLTSWQWLVLLVCPPFVLGAEEVRKWIARRMP